MMRQHKMSSCCSLALLQHPAMQYRRGQLIATRSYRNHLCASRNTCGFCFPSLSPSMMRICWISTSPDKKNLILKKPNINHVWPNHCLSLAEAESHPQKGNNCLEQTGKQDRAGNRSTEMAPKEQPVSSGHSGERQCQS